MDFRLPFAVAPLLIGTVTSGNARSNRPASNLGMLDQLGMTWKSDGPDNLWVRGQLFEPAEIDFVSLIGGAALPDTTIRVRLGTSAAEVDGNAAAFDSGTDPFIDPATTTANGLYHSHTELSNPATATHWRIDVGNHTGDFEATGLVLGKRVTPTEYYDRDWERGVEDLGELNINRQGVVSERPGVVLRTLGFKLGWMNEDEYEDDFRPLIEGLATRGISYWCFNPFPNKRRQGRTYLGYFQNAPFVRAGPIDDIHTMDFRIRSII